MTFFGGGNPTFSARLGSFGFLPLGLAFLLRLLGVGFVKSFGGIFAVQLRLEFVVFLLEFLDQLLLGNNEIDPSIKAHVIFGDVLFELLRVHDHVLTDTSTAINLFHKMGVYGLACQMTVV
ncbi:MAG: hypothetical protein N2C14_07585 [Planctomycetales bacterium]